MKDVIKSKLPLVISCAAALLILFMMFGFSNQDGNESSRASSLFVDYIIKALNLSDAQETVSKVTLIIRKLAHFTIFAALGMSLGGVSYNLFTKRRFLCAASAGLLVAVLDESHQIFVSGRTASVKDVLIDFSGALCGAAFMFLIIYIVKKLREKRG